MRSLLLSHFSGSKGATMLNKLLIFIAVFIFLLLIPFGNITTNGEILAISDEVIEPIREESFDDMTIPELIEHYAIEYGHDPDVMLAIAQAESRFRNVPNYLYDGESGRYTAFGIFQITKTTWKYLCGDDVHNRKVPIKNIECAMKIADDSLSHWDESKHAWQ